MQFVQHRVNSIKQLEELNQSSPEFGVEIDIRSDGKDLYLEHDSFWSHKPVTLEDYLKAYKLKGTLITNLKCEGIEEKCLELFSKYSVSNYFFLDMSMPFFVKFANRAKKNDGLSPENLAVRVSEFEALEYALGFTGKAKWAWVDCFSPSLYLDSDIHQKLKAAGFKVCLVSPELQKHDTAKIQEFKSKLNSLGIKADAVCSKRPDLWM